MGNVNVVVTDVESLCDSLFWPDPRLSFHPMAGTQEKRRNVKLYQDWCCGHRICVYIACNTLPGISVAPALSSSFTISE